MGHKWVVIQRRCFSDTDFYRDWSDYKHGFGNFKENHDFWIGNDNIHLLTTDGYSYLRIEMLKTDDEPLEADYERFMVEDEDNKYRINVTGFQGNHDCMTSSRWGWNLHGMVFSTFDEDHDSAEHNCAASLRSGWWFKSCTCGNLNGLIGKNKYDSMRWACSSSDFCQLKAARILLRRHTP
ncbi:fibrinogen-like protein 1 [Ostrea edulis]|uniref:fibrinogen-like protein 1 n=1 Tax=Ostrea edulis TaxID=37623 RepID=UPI0024AEBBCE|nr:fibrinogen-like protein 1 [Ostrea edulis]